MANGKKRKKGENKKRKRQRKKGEQREKGKKGGERQFLYTKMALQTLIK